MCVCVCVCVLCTGFCASVRRSTFQKFNNEVLNTPSTWNGRSAPKRVAHLKLLISLVPAAHEHGRYRYSPCAGEFFFVLAWQENLLCSFVVARCLSRELDINENFVSTNDSRNWTTESSSMLATPSVPYHKFFCSENFFSSFSFIASTFFAVAFAHTSATCGSCHHAADAENRSANSGDWERNCVQINMRAVQCETHETSNNFNWAHCVRLHRKPLNIPRRGQFS